MTREASQHDEIDLVDLWLTLLRRKVLIAIVFAAVVGIAMFWSLTRTPVYQARAILHTGEIDGAGISYSDVAPTPAFPENIEKAEQDGTTLKIVVHRSSAKGAREHAASASAHALEQLRAEYNELRATAERQRSTKERRIATIEDRTQRIDQSRNRISQFSRENGEPLDNESAQGNMLLAEIEALKMQRKLEAERRSLEEALAGTDKFSAPKITSINDASELPFQPNILMTSALSVIFGLMLGVFAAFFAEVLASARQRLAAENDG